MLWKTVIYHLLCAFMYYLSSSTHILMSSYKCTVLMVFPRLSVARAFTYYDVFKKKTNKKISCSRHDGEIGEMRLFFGFFVNNLSFTETKL